MVDDVDAVKRTLCKVRKERGYFHPIANALWALLLLWRFGRPEAKAKALQICEELEAW